MYDTPTHDPLSDLRHRIPFVPSISDICYAFRPAGSCQTNGPNGIKQKGKRKGRRRAGRGKREKMKYAGNVSVLVVSNPSINIYNPPRKKQSAARGEQQMKLSQQHVEEDGEEEEEE